MNRYNRNDYVRCDWPQDDVDVYKFGRMCLNDIIIFFEASLCEQYVILFWFLAINRKQHFLELP